MIQRWCTLEGGYLSYYEGERNTTPIGRVDISEMVSLAINNTETMTGAGYDPPLLCTSSSFPFPFIPFLIALLVLFSDLSICFTESVCSV